MYSSVESKGAPKASRCQESSQKYIPREAPVSKALFQPRPQFQALGLDPAQSVRAAGSSILKLAWDCLSQ